MTARWMASLPDPSPLPPPDIAAAVRLIGIVGGKRELKVFERSKLLPFAIGIKPDRRKPDEIEWWAQCAALCCPAEGSAFASRNISEALFSHWLSLQAQRGGVGPAGGARRPAAAEGRPSCAAGGQISIRIDCHPSWRAALQALSCTGLPASSCPSRRLHLTTFQHCSPQGRIKVERWEDKNTGQKRSAMKIVAASISRVRSMLPPRDASTASEGAEAPVEQAPWDALPPAPAQMTPRAPAAAAQQQQMTTEDKWMDFFMHPDSERTLKRPCS